jgi:hypothetical protein
MRSEVGELVGDWWCRGGGAAVLALVAVVSTFRGPSDLIFWAAVGFLVGHTAIAVRRWTVSRRLRTTATVTRHHGPRPDPLLPSLPGIPARGLRFPLIQTKNTP